MKRHYFISDDLDDLEIIETQLEDNGISTPQIHVLSESDGDVESHHLHDVNSLMKQDVVHSWEVGAVVGVCASLLVLAGAYFTGLTATAAGWIPFIFLAIVVLGFCTWEGGLFGLRKPNIHFKRFEEALHAGKHILFVEVDPDQETLMAGVLHNHPKLQPAGSAAATPRWIIVFQQKWRAFIESMP